MFFVIGICLNTQAYYVEHNTGFVFIEVLPLHVCYMFRHFLRVSSGLSTKMIIKENVTKLNKTILFYYIFLYEIFIFTCLMMTLEKAETCKGTI